MNSFVFFLLFIVPSYDSAGQMVVPGVPAIPASHGHVIMILICTYNCLSSTPENQWEGQQTRLQISPTYASSIIPSAFTLCWSLTPPCTPSLKCAMTLVHPHTTSLLCDVSIVQPHAPFLIHLVSHTPHLFSDSHGTPLAHALTCCAPSTLTCTSYTSPTHAALLTNLCISLHTTSHLPCLHGASHACLPPCNIAFLSWSSCMQDSKEWIKLKEAEKIYHEFVRNIVLMKNGCFDEEWMKRVKEGVSRNLSRIKKLKL